MMNEVLIPCADPVGEDAGDEPVAWAAGGADGRTAAETSRAGESVGSERRPGLSAAGNTFTPALLQILQLSVWISCRIKLVTRHMSGKELKLWPQSKVYAFCMNLIVTELKKILGCEPYYHHSVCLLKMYNQPVLLMDHFTGQHDQYFTRTVTFHHKIHCHFIWNVFPRFFSAHIRPCVCASCSPSDTSRIHVWETLLIVFISSL